MTDNFKRVKTSHYELWPGTEVIDVLKNTLTPEELQGFLKGNILKYRLRAGKKDDAAKDLAKAEHYAGLLRELIEECEVPDQEEITEATWAEYVEWLMKKYGVGHDSGAV